MNYATYIEETCEGTREVSVYAKHLAKRRIFLTESIDAESANNIISQLLLLDDLSGEDIDMYINSPGGEVTSGLLIYDVMQSLNATVNVYCTGIAASMAAVILAGGRPGHRFILPHSKTMIHEPLISNGVGGSASSIKNISDSILETKKIINGILAKHTGKTIREINKATSHDHYMTAKESVAFGLCDEIKGGLIYGK